MQKSRGFPCHSPAAEEIIEHFRRKDWRVRGADFDVSKEAREATSFRTNCKGEVGQKTGPDQERRIPDRGEGGETRKVSTLPGSRKRGDVEEVETCSRDIINLKGGKCYYESLRLRRCVNLKGGKRWELGENALPGTNAESSFISPRKLSQSIRKGEYLSHCLVLPNGKKRMPNGS